MKYSNAKCRLIVLSLCLSTTSMMGASAAAVVHDSISLVQNTSDHSDDVTSHDEGFGGISNRMSIEKDGTYKVTYGD